MVAKSRDQRSTEANTPKLGFGLINKARFLQPVYPPGTVVTEITAVKLLSTMGIVDAVSRVGNDTVAKATIQFGSI